MQIKKVITELQERMEDPFEKDAASKFIQRLKEVEDGKNPVLGKMLYELLVKAENGGFK
jgi:hypothetical protein